MTAGQLVKADRQSEQWTGERCYITELCNTDALPGSSLAVARVEPGITTQLHHLEGTIETYIVKQGEGEMELDGTSFAIAPGDQVIIPAGIPQRVTATGHMDLIFYCLCTPRFFPRCYVDLENSE